MKDRLLFTASQEPRKRSLPFKPFMVTLLTGCGTYVMGGRLMFYEYPEKWNAMLEEFLNRL